MADTLKVLAQGLFTGTPGTPAALYTVGASTSAAISTITVCNTDTSGRTFSIKVAIAGAANADQQFLYKNVVIAPNQTITLTVGITLATTDVIRIDASVASKVAFSVFGVEVT